MSNDWSAQEAWEEWLAARAEFEAVAKANDRYADFLVEAWAEWEKEEAWEFTPDGVENA